jgi:type VII secretion effector (TIGR04197 family)
LRPVNLIPPEERPGERRPMRGGPLAYVIVGALAAAVIGVAVLAITGNQISESKAEITRLEGEKSAVEARAQELDAYTQFHSVSEQRTATITSLADSRFDWQRVMHELALILPDDVWLTNLTGTASPNVSVDGAGSIALRSTIPGPALELTGCTTSQSAVARFIQALKEIDGVTRVGVQTSSLSGSNASSGSGSGSSTCGSKTPVAQFQMVLAFDAAPVAIEEEGESVAPEGEPATAAASSESGGEE